MMRNVAVAVESFRRPPDSRARRCRYFGLHPTAAAVLIGASFQATNSWTDNRRDSLPKNLLRELAPLHAEKWDGELSKNMDDADTVVAVLHDAVVQNPGESDDDDGV
jgi:hypothetical protein